MKNWISTLWCKTMHGRAMWPIHGKYICPDCLREYPVFWEETQEPVVSLTKPRAVPSRISVAP
jgi:hypothetical protein